MTSGTREKSEGLEHEFRELISQDKNIENICQTSLENWHLAFHKETFLRNLEWYQTLMHGSGHPEGDELELKRLYKYFKEVRKAGQYLRTVFVILDKGHDPPESFQTFVWALGQLNDAFDFPDKSLALTTVLKNTVDQGSEWGNFKVRPDAVESILRLAKQPLYRVTQLLESQELSANDFHELRKKLRFFTNIYTLAVKYGQTGEVHTMRDMLVQINDELGAINDDWVQKSLQGEKKYESNVIRLDPALIAQINTVLMGKVGDEKSSD